MGFVGQLNLGFRGHLRWDYAVRKVIEKQSEENNVATINSEADKRKTGNSEIDKALGRYSDNDYKVRLSAIHTLGKIPDPSVVPTLICALKDDADIIRKNAAYYLGEIKDVCAVEPLIEALKDSDSVVRQNSATSLGNIRDVRAIEPLINHLLHSQDKYVIFALASFGDAAEEHINSALNTAINTGNEEIQNRLLTALSLIKDKKG
jgi:HEAT repeat protein